MQVDNAKVRQIFWLLLMNQINVQNYFFPKKHCNIQRIWILISFKVPIRFLWKKTIWSKFSFSFFFGEWLSMHCSVNRNGMSLHTTIDKTAFVVFSIINEVSLVWLSLLEWIHFPVWRSVNLSKENKRKQLSPLNNSM